LQIKQIYAEFFDIDKNTKQLIIPSSKIRDGVIYEFKVSISVKKSDTETLQSFALVKVKGK